MTTSSPSRLARSHDTAGHTGLSPLATGPLCVIGALLGGVLLYVSATGGLFADELYFVAAGKHLAWGYVDQAPGLPLMASAIDAVFHGSRIALRLPAVLAAVAVLFVAALTARELGGARWAQLIAAAACAVSLQFASGGTYLVTWSFDPLLWSVVIWLVVRWVRLHHAGADNDRLLLWAGLVTALAVQIKLLIPALWCALCTAVLICGPRRMLTRPMLWWGGAVAAAAVAPTLVWQAVHGWPQLAMASVIAEELAGTNTLLRVFKSAGIVGAVLIPVGLWALVGSRQLRDYRFVGWAALGLSTVLLFSGGRSYYVAGFYVVLFSAGAVLIERYRHAIRPRALLWPVYPAFALAAYMTLSLLPPFSPIETHEVLPRASVGWKQVTATVARAYRQIPADQRAHTAVVTSDYWSASAIHYYGPAMGIDEVYSPSRGFWYFGRPNATTQQVLYLDADPRYLRKHFDTVRLVVTVNTGLPTYYEGKKVWLAEDPRQPWSRMWSELRHLSIWRYTPSPDSAKRDQRHG